MEETARLHQGRSCVRYIGPLIALVVCITAFRPSPEAHTDPVGSAAQLSMGGEALASAEPQMGSAEKSCLESGFTDHIHVGTVGSHAAISHPTLKFKVSSLKSAIAAAGNCSPTGTYKTGIVVHYGLDGTNQLDLALEVLCLTWDETSRTYSYTSNGSYYKISNDQLSLVQNGLAAWKGGAGKKYADNVVIQRSTGTGWEPFKAKQDVVSTVFPYELHLKQMIAQNNLADADYIHVTPGAEPMEWEHDGSGGINEYNYRQGLVWIPDPSKITLNEAEYGYGKEFKNKAADLGSACPPGCPMVTFQTSGLRRRPNC